MSSIPTIFTITHKCGHQEDRDLSDTPAGQRAGKAEWWEIRPCFDCYKKSSRRKLSKEIQNEPDDTRYAELADRAERGELRVKPGTERRGAEASAETRRLLAEGDSS